MPEYVLQLWVTVSANDLTDATNRAHLVSVEVEHLDNVQNVFIGDEYEKVINEYGDTEPMEAWVPFARNESCHECS